MMTEFDITHDRLFLSHFWDTRKIFRLSPLMVERLRCSEDPYGKYGYGQWLYRIRPSGNESVKEAQRCFEYASMNGVADAKQMLSLMAYNGDLYNDSKGGIWEKSNVLALALNAQAREEGSELAVIRHNIDLYDGNLAPADRRKAFEEAQKMATVPKASLLWTEQLGWYHDIEGRTEEAKKAYKKCVEGGLYDPLYDLAIMHYLRDDLTSYDSLMKEGIEKGIAACMIWGFEREDEWDELSNEQQNEIHDRLAMNLYKGVELGNPLCAYFLASYMINGTMGFKKDIAGGLRIAHKGVSYHGKECSQLILNIIEDEYLKSTLPEELTLPGDEYPMMLLKATRLGDEISLESLIRNHTDRFIELGYGDEMKFWTEKYKEILSMDAEEDKTPALESVEKTEIMPTVLVIHPSGYTEFVPADVNPMSFSEMGALIDAKSVDAVHFSNPLTQITKKCGLNKNVTMYVDKEAMMKDLEDNAVATMLYGKGYEIRGAAIIAMEDNRYDTYSFETEEDIEAVFEAIDEMTGLLRRETDDDGRNDAWA